MTQLICQSLKMVCFHSSCIMENIVMSWWHCALTNRLADHEKVIPFERKKYHSSLSWQNLLRKTHKPFLLSHKNVASYMDLLRISLVVNIRYNTAWKWYISGRGKLDIKLEKGEIKWGNKWEEKLAEKIVNEKVGGW